MIADRQAARLHEFIDVLRGFIHVLGIVLEIAGTHGERLTADGQRSFPRQRRVVVVYVGSFSIRNHLGGHRVISDCGDLDIGRGVACGRERKYAQRKEWNKEQPQEEF